MKVKCNDYLPAYDGDFETDLGVLAIRNYGRGMKVWYKYTINQCTNFKVLNYIPVKPVWWDNPKI